MENYESADGFLKECAEGKSGSAVIYEIHNDGGLERMKFIFDGTDMYVVSARGIWNADNRPGISYIPYCKDYDSHDPYGHRLPYAGIGILHKFDI